MLSATNIRFASGMILVMCFAASPQIRAGEFEKIGASAGQYTFTQCLEPQMPVLALDPKKTGNAAVLDYNRQVDRLNVYLAKVQAHMECLSAEADLDLQTYYNAVSASLTVRQQAMQDRVSDLRQVLAKGPNRKKRHSVPPADLPALAGGPQETSSDESGDEIADKPAAKKSPAGKVDESKAPLPTAGSAQEPDKSPPPGR